MRRARAVCTVIVVLAVAQFVIAASQPAQAMPTSDGLRDTAAAVRGCTFADTSSFVGPIVVSDLADGLSSDRRGPYIAGRDGVIAGGRVGSGVSNSAALTIYQPEDAPGRSPRGYSVNLNSPVLGGGGHALGIIEDKSGAGMGLMAQWGTVDEAFRNLHGIRVGQTVTAAMTSVTFFIGGHRHILQMGPVPNGHCHGTTLVTGKGTTAATIKRAATTRWVVDLPGGSIGRLFDVTDGTGHAVDKGRYYFRLHYEIGQ